MSMKNLLSALLSIIILLSLSTVLAGCQVVGDIFGAGFYTGIFVVVIVVVVVIVIISKVGRNK